MQEILSMPRRAYSYARISDPKQAKGDGLRRQGVADADSTGCRESFAERVCREQGWCLDDSLTFVDKGKSGYHGDNRRRGQLGEFLRMVKTGRIPSGSVIIIENIDRLSREEMDEAYDGFRGLLRAGIWIATELPERIYNRANSNDLLNVIEPLMIMYRAHEESKLKSKRISAQWETRRRKARQEGRPTGGKRPAWIDLTPEGYRLIPSRAHTLQEAARLLREGMGFGRVVEWFRAHPKEHPAFTAARIHHGRETGGVWMRATLRAIITGREIVGEFQPRRGLATQSKKQRQADGEPIQRYYPAVLTEDEWLLTQAAIGGRRLRSGRPGNHEVNLFTGIVREAMTRLPMSVKSITGTLAQRKAHPEWYPYPYLVTTKFGDLGCAKAKGLAYSFYESDVLQAVEELKPADVLPPETQDDARQSRIKELTGEVVAMDLQIDTLKAGLKKPGQKPQMLQILQESLDEVLDAKEKAGTELRALNLDSLTGRSEALGEVQSLIKFLRTAPADQLEDLRRRVKAALRWIVDSIWVVVQPINQIVRIGHVQIFLRSGGLPKYLQVLPRYKGKPVSLYPYGVEIWDFRDRDLRHWDAHWIADNPLIVA